MKTNYIISLIISLSIGISGQAKDNSLEVLNSESNANIPKEIVLSLMDTSSVIDYYEISSPSECDLNDDYIDGLSSFVEWTLVKPEHSTVDSQIEYNENLLSVSIEGDTINFSSNRFQLIKMLTLLHGIRNTDNAISDVKVNFVWSTHKGNKRWMLVYRKHFGLMD